MDSSSNVPLVNLDMVPDLGILSQDIHDAMMPAVITSTDAGEVVSIQSYSAPSAAANLQLVKLVSQVFNESFGYRPDGRPYRLGPKSISRRLQETDYLFIAGDEHFGVGYCLERRFPLRKAALRGLNQWRYYRSIESVALPLNWSPSLRRPQPEPCDWAARRQTRSLL